MAFQFNIPTDNSPSPLLQLSDGIKDYNQSLRQQNQDMFALSRNNMENRKLAMEEEKQPLLLEGMRQGNEQRGLEIGNAILKTKAAVLGSIKSRLDANPNDPQALADYDRWINQDGMKSLVAKHGPMIPKDAPGAVKAWMDLTEGYKSENERLLEELKVRGAKEEADIKSAARADTGMVGNAPGARLRPSPGMTPPTASGTGVANPDGISVGQRFGAAGTAGNPVYARSAKDVPDDVPFTSPENLTTPMIKRNGVPMTLAQYQAQGGEQPNAPQAPQPGAAQPQEALTPADIAYRRLMATRERYSKLAASATPGVSENAAKMVENIDKQIASGQIPGPDGRMHQPPGYAENKRAEKAAEAEGQKRQENHKKAVEDYNQASDMLGTARDVKLLSQLAVTGQFADFETQARKFATRLGFSDPDNKITATELLKSALTKLVATEAQKMKPVSNSDITFLQSAIGSISADPRSLLHIAGSLERSAERQQLYHEIEMKAYDPRAGSGYVDPKQIREAINQQFPSYVSTTFGVKQDQPGQAGAQPGAPQQAGQAPQQPAGDLTPAQQQLASQPNGTRVGMYVMKNGRYVLSPPDGSSPPQQQPQPPPAGLPPGVAPELPEGYPAQRVQMRRHAEQQQAEAQRAQQLAQVQGQFEADARALPPVEVARKYDSMRSMLTESQLYQLNDLISRMTRR